MSSYRYPLGVLMNHPDFYHHVRNILAELEPGSFEIVVAGEREACEALLAPTGYPHVWYQELQSRPQPCYRYSLSNHYIYYYSLEEGGGERKIFLAQLLGQEAIRLHYSLGLDHWTYADWNQIYSVQLCYGPWHAERLQSFKADIYQIGYPRYDDYFNHPPDRQAWLERLGADPDKPTLVMLPTRHQHTLRTFGKTLSSLSDRYNVLIKPHPLTWGEEPGLIQWLKMLPLTRLVEPGVDNLYLYALADTVICDYGGASFGAIYTDRPLLLFNHYPNVSFDPTGMNLPPDSPTRLEELNPTEQYLRKSIPSLNPDQQHSLRDTLANSELWEAQKAVRAQLREQFFAPFYGTSAAEAARVIKQYLAKDS